VPGQLPCKVASENDIDTSKSHASVAVAAVNTGIAGQLRGLACVVQVIVGALMSCTEIVRLQVAILLQSSVAIQVRVTL